jgi:transcriptional regulator with XRE-family HTH domain
LPNKDLVYREFGVLLAAERKRKRLSQSQLGELAGLSRTSITNIECGRQPIQLHQLFSFASILRIDVKNLLPKESVLGEELRTGSHEPLARYIADAKNFLEKLPTSSTEDDHG